MVAVSARKSKAIRCAEAPGFSRITTDPSTISDPTAATRSAAVTCSIIGATISVANSTGSYGAASTNFPFRAIVRHAETWFAFRPYRRATSPTVVPGRSVSATIRAFS